MSQSNNAERLRQALRQAIGYIEGLADGFQCDGDEEAKKLAVQMREVAVELREQL